ncbi:MAG: beta-lactamase family protein [Acetatifactor sp.]|nr:beta-lactamase family protein [Acetatifactor sp.]
MGKYDGSQDVLRAIVNDGFAKGANCLVYRDGKEEYYGQCGEISRESICHLYSASKPVTSAGFMLAFERGLIDLMDPVSRYLPGFKNQKYCRGDELVPVSREVTIKDLLNMQSGLVYPGDGDLAEKCMDRLFQDIENKVGTEEEYTTNQIANMIGQSPLAFDPGRHWRYGLSADILGAVIEVVTGETFGEFLQRNLFDPLGMKDTGFFVPKEKRARMLRVYDMQDGKLCEYHENHLGINIDMNKKPLFESGGAGLVGTIDDYLNFAKMLLDGGRFENKQILGSNTVKFMTSGRLHNAIKDDLLSWSGLDGFQYGNLLRIAVDPGLCMYNAPKGAYGWDGWLGCYFMNIPSENACVLIFMQRTGAGISEYTRRMINQIMSV